MPRRPAAKKQRDYKKQSRGFSKYKHSLRGGKWRRTKRRPAQQAERQAERRAVATRSDAELRDVGFDPGAIERQVIAKWGATPLGEWMQHQKRVRVAREGGKARRRKARR